MSVKPTALRREIVHPGPLSRTRSSDKLPEPRVHPGRDWFSVLHGTVRLRLGDREILVEAGQAASFDTMTPHSMVRHGAAAAEVLIIVDHHGERAHLREA